MAKRYFNWKLAIVLLIGLGVLGITAYELRRWQRNRRAEQGLVRGNEAYNRHRWEESAEQLGRYLAVEKDDVPALFKYAEAQLKIRPSQQGNIRQAIAAYRTILRVAKGNSEAANRLSQIYLRMGMPGEAELIATRALQTTRSPEVRRILAIALAKQRKFNEAAIELKSIIEEHPEQIPAYRALGQLIEQRAEDFAQAPQFWFDEAVKNNPVSAQAYIMRAAFHLRHNRTPQAVADLAQAEQKDLSNPTARLQLAEQFVEVGDLDKAREHLNIVQLSDPQNQLLWRIWARLALKSSSKAIMLQVAENGSKELSSDPWDFMPLATELYIRCGKHGLAADCVNKLRQYHIAPVATAFLEGLLADARGHPYEAIKYWHQATQLGAKSVRTRLALAATLSRVGDKHSALRQLRSLVTEQPNLLTGRLNLARLLTEVGNWAEAAEQARIAMQISPDNLDASLLYTQARIQLLSESKTTQDSLIYQDIEHHLARLEQAVNSAPEVKFLRFQLAMQQSDFETAEALVIELGKTYPSQTKIAMAEIELLTAWDKIDEAILRLYDAVTAFPNSVSPVRRLAALLAAKGEHQECESIVEAALSRIKQPAAERELGLLLAALYDRWNEQEKRYELLSTLVHKYSEDIPLQRELLKCERALKNPSFAQQLIDRMRSVEGENGWQWRYEQAKLFAAQDNFDDYYPQIVILLKQALVANPDDQASRMLLAATYERAGELRLAVSTYSEALSRSPRDIRIIVPTVAVLYKADEYHRADEILRRAASEKVFHPELKKLEFQGHLRRGELKPACNALQDWLANDPNNSSVCLSLALLKMRQNSLPEAAEFLTELKMRQPDALPVTVAQIELNARQGNSDRALSLCEQVIKKFNNASAYVLRARTYAILGQAHNAERDFEYAAAIEPNNAQAWVAKSDFYRAAGSLDKAINSISKAGALEPDDLGICKRMLSLYLASADSDMLREAKDILDNALTLNPEDIELHLYRACLLLTEATAAATEQALDILQKITEERPKLSEAWTLLAEIALRRQQSVKAIDIVLRGLVHSPNDKSLLLLKARAEAASSPALAVPTLKALLDSDPNDIDVALRLADTYLAAGNFEKAVNLLRKQLISHSSSIAAERKIRLVLAAALHKSGNKADAQKEFDFLISSAPSDPAPLVIQARLLKEDKRWEQLKRKVCDWYTAHLDDADTPTAIAADLITSEDSRAQETAEHILRMILHHDSACTQAMSALAAHLQMTGRSPESAALYQRILELEPDNVIAINNLAWIMCRQYGKCREALDLAHRGLRTRPEYIDLIDTRGVVYYELGQYEKAIHDFNTCLKMYPRGTSAAAASYLHLGRALAKVGNKREAIETLKRALELNAEFRGLSPTDVAEAQRLLEKLSQGV